MAAIVNKFAGTCKTCSTRVPAGKGIARKAAKGWDVLCNDHKGETHGATNPWKAIHKNAALDYASTPREASREMALVDSEFGHTDELAEPCETPGCGGTMHYRATVGAPQCPDCRAMVVYKIDQKTLVTTRKVIR
jgi:hypothetical protein